jgi:hypothetical protein
MGRGLFVPFLGNIEIAVAAPVFLHIVFPVNAGTEDISVFLPIA